MRSRWILLVFLFGACGGDSAPPDGIVSGSRLRAVFLQAEGVRQWAAWQDTARDERCSFQVVDDGIWRCLPATSWTSTYADAACTEPVLVWSTSPCTPEPAPYMGVAAAGGCGVLAAIRATGDPISPSTVYDLDGVTGDCVARTPDPSEDFFAAGDDVPMASFVSAELSPDGESGRLVRGMLRADDGSRAPWTLFDHELDARCFAYWGDGDEARCILNGIGAFLYGDPACTEPVASVGAACADGTPPFVLRFERDVCGNTLASYRRGDPHAGEVYLDNGLACEPYAPGEEQLFDLGEELTDSLATATRVRGDEAGRLQHFWLESDGRRVDLTYGFFDTERGEECDLVDVGGGIRRCVPAGAITNAQLFADNACSQAVEVVEQSVPPCDTATPAPAVAMIWIADGACATRLELHEVGASIASGTLFAGGPGNCAAATWDTDQIRRYELGAAIPLDQFVELTEATE